MSSNTVGSVRPGGLPQTVKANSSSAQVFADAGVSSTAALILPIPNSGKLEGKKFKVRASGYCTTVGTYTVTITLGYKAAIPATPLTLSNWTTLGASSARTVDTTSAPWWIEADLEFDLVSLAIQGTFDAMVNNLYNVKAAITNALTITAVEPIAYVVAAITFSTGSASNIGVLSDFVIEG